MNGVFVRGLFVPCFFSCGGIGGGGVFLWGKESRSAWLSELCFGNYVFWTVSCRGREGGVGRECSLFLLQELLV